MSNLFSHFTRKQFIISSFCLLVLTTSTVWGAEGKDSELIPEPQKSQKPDVGQDLLWKGVSRFTTPSVQAQNPKKPKNSNRRMPRKYRMLELNVHALEAILRRAPAEDVWQRKKGVVLTLPMPDGGFEAFSISETSMMEPELAAKFPELKTYTGVGIDDPTATVRISWTPRGIEVIVIGTGGTYFVDPFEPGHGAINYISYKSEEVPREPWNEELPPLPESETETSSKSKDSKTEAQKSRDSYTLDVSSGSIWRTYRLAITTSQEYYTNNGGSDALVMAAITSKVNQLNAIYERELAVRFTLVANNDLLLNQAFNDTGFNISASSPNVTSLIDGIIGSGAYDFGHLLLWAYGGGVAYTYAVCNSNRKADGQSGVNASIDTLAHEIGHMFAMHHTWNKCGTAPNDNRTASSAYEPGAGNTIMSYANTCGGDNLLGDLLQFHVRSYEQADSYIASGGSCYSSVASGNAPPVANSGTASITIPASTPFLLQGSATDADNDELSYSWEGYDLGLLEVAPNTGNAPFFRVFKPKETPVRVFPQHSDLVNGTTTLGEELPSTDQTLNFRFHVYDGRGGVSYVEPNTQVVVDGDSGPFQVLTPNSSSVSWVPGASETVTWNVAGTGSGTTVDCDNVAIDLSVDGGYSYPVPMTSSTANDGSHSITVPNVTSAAARVRVRCADVADHFFFDISDNNFVVDAAPGTGECPSSDSVTVNSLADLTASDNSCTLREAVAAVNSGGTITFDSALVNGVITLASQITIDKSMTIDGGDRTITVSGGKATRIFYIYRSGSVITVALKNFTLTDGYVSGDYGGAVRTRYERTTLERMVVSNSLAEAGGAIYYQGSSSAPLEIKDSTLSGNFADFLGGALFLSGNSGSLTSIDNSTFVDNQVGIYSNSAGGAIATYNSNLSVVNSTFNGNVSTAAGGAISDYASSTSTVFTIRNSTFDGNVAYGDNVGHGVGANIYHLSSGGQVHISNSIISGAFGDDIYTVLGSLTTNTNNLIGDGSYGSAYSGDPLLGVLADNGGHTKTMALMSGSPALGVGSGCETLDQRGYTRDAACDIGAYEAVGCNGASYTVTDDQWQLISLPCDPGANNTVAEVFGDDLTGVNGTDWGVFTFDETAGTSGSYSLLTDSSTVTPGKGYWLIKVNGSGSWSMETTDKINTEPFEVPLVAAHDGTAGQQNMVGNPTTRTLAWEDIKVLSTYGNCYGSPSIASTAGTDGLISNAINYYNGSGYTVCDDSGSNPPCEIAPGEGFWVYVPDNSETNARLMVGGACESGSQVTTIKGGNTAIEKQKTPEGWAVFLKVNSGSLEDPVNTLGQRANASIGYDRNDLKELVPDRTPYMTLVFPHADWGDKAGDYGADYQPLSTSGTSEWHFVIRTSEVLEDLTISWQAPENILKYSQLVDQDTGEKIKLKNLQSYATEWYGLQERHFKWVLKKVKSKNKSAFVE